MRAQQIQQLPSALSEKLRAPLVVGSLAQALEELAANSVDAQATLVDIHVDLSSLSLTVADDGHGIEQGSFKSLAKRHATSKLQNVTQLDSGVSTLGFKGEALASIAEVSLLHVISKAKGSFETHLKLLKGGNLVKQGLAREQRQKTGTTVYIKDFMFNQPVRRRQYLQSGSAHAAVVAIVVAAHIVNSIERNAMWHAAYKKSLTPAVRTRSV